MPSKETLLAAFNRGLTVPDYVDRMTTLKRHMEDQLTATDTAMPAQSPVVAAFAAAAAPHRPLKFLVMTEDYCPDSVLNLPIALRLAELLPEASVRVIYRADYPDLAEAYPAADGFNHIPTIILLAADGTELGVWHERPTIARQFLAQFEADNPQPAKEDAAGEVTMAYRQWAKTRLDALKGAYRQTLWRGTVEELTAQLAR